MPWFKVEDAVPADGESVLIYDGRHNRVEVGRRVGGRWFVEDPTGGRPTEVAGVTHWTPPCSTRRGTTRPTNEA